MSEPQGPAFPEFPKVFDAREGKDRAPEIIFSQAHVRAEEVTTSAFRFDLLHLIAAGRQLLVTPDIAPHFLDLYGQYNEEEKAGKADDVVLSALYAARAAFRLAQGKADRAKHWAVESLRHSARASMLAYAKDPGGTTYKGSKAPEVK